MNKKTASSWFQNFINFGANFSQLFLIAILSFIALYFVSYAIFGASPIANFKTVLLSSALGLIMCLAIWFTRKRPSFDLIIVLAFSMLIYFFPRLLEYLVVKQENLKLLYILFPIHWTPEDINKGLTYVVIGTCLLIAGVLTGEFIFYKYSKYPRGSDLNKVLPLPTLTSLTIAGVVIYLVDGYYTIYMGLSASSNCSVAEVAGKWLIHFFSGDIYIFAVIVALAANFKKIMPQGKLFLFVSLLIYLIYTVLLGSRGGILRLVTIGFSIAVALQRDFKIKFVSLALLLPFLIFSSYGAFFLGTAIRESKRLSCGGEHVPLEQAVDNAGYEAHPRFVDRYKNDTRNIEKIELPPKYAKILDRLGVLDYALGLTVMSPNPEAQEKYLNVEYPLKNLANNLLPGVPYPDHQKMTNNMMPILYRGFDLQHINENFLSEPFTIWGLSIVYFGYWGGLLFMFVSAIFMQMLYLYCTHRSGNYSVMFKSAFVWLIATGAYFFNMGFDHIALIWIYGLFQFIVSIGLIYGSDYSFDRLTKYYQSRQ